MQAQQSSGGAIRHSCHCGKQFIRKEHLRRHQATHGGKAYVCHICQRSFTRNDLLQRHIGSHANPSRAAKGRACDACHSNKTKCDGQGSQCSFCRKRSIECIYSKIKIQEAEQSTLQDEEPAEPKVFPWDPPAHRPERKQTEEDHAPFLRNPQFVRSQLLDVLEGLRAQRSAPIQDARTPKATKDWFAHCLEAFLGGVHTRWTLVHSPTYDLTEEPFDNAATVLMLGAWLLDRRNTRDLVMKIHQHLVAKYHQILSRKTRPSGNGCPWPFEVYQAIILQLVFALYSPGDHNIRQQALNLRVVFVETLREVDFFNATTAEQYQKRYFPGTFFPFVHTYYRTWKQIILNIFTVDIQFSMLVGTLPLLQQSEVDIGLPSTFALQNAYGLDQFYQRRATEPVNREQSKMLRACEMSLDTEKSPTLLGEDLLLYLHGLFSAAWTAFQIRSADAGLGANCQTEIQRKLELVGNSLANLIRICDRVEMGQTSTEKDDAVLRAYLGRTEEGDEAWRKVAAENLRRLVNETVILYNTLGLMLYLPLRPTVLAALDASQCEDGISVLATGDLLTSLRQWLASSNGRRAVVYGLGTLLGSEAWEAAKTESPTMPMATPIQPVALMTAALVVKVWAQLSHDSITTGGIWATCNCQNGMAVELETGPAGLVRGNTSESWVNTGGPVWLQGQQVCFCNIDHWNCRFTRQLQISLSTDDDDGSQMPENPVALLNTFFVA